MSVHNSAPVCATELSIGTNQSARRNLAVRSTGAPYEQKHVSGKHCALGATELSIGAPESGIGVLSFCNVPGASERWLMVYFQNCEHKYETNELLGRNGSGIGLVSFRPVGIDRLD